MVLALVTSKIVIFAVLIIVCGVYAVVRRAKGRNQS